MRIMAETIRRSSSALWVLAFFVVIAVVLFSSIVFYMEKFACPSKISSMSPDEQILYDNLCEHSVDGYELFFSCGPKDFVDLHILIS